MSSSDNRHPLAAIYVPVLNGMVTTGPKTLRPRLAVEADELDVPEAVDESNLRSHLLDAELDDLLRKRLHLALAAWDYAPTQADWAKGTEPSTTERRATTYDALGLEDETRHLLDDLFRFLVDDSIIISREFENWYTDEVRQERGFYWDSYRRYLADTARWEADTIGSIDASTTRVMQRLARPTREEAYPARGLVVGYVQSGKTANFTGVVAKAIDAGYRLIIILTGTTNLLRAQTQRRLDKELVGVENILRWIDPTDPASLDKVDYQGDPDWIASEFVRHGNLPSEMHHPDIYRLTTYRGDYKGLGEGITTLELERPDHAKKLYHPDNLFRTNARLMVIKKNKAPLTKVVTDLKKIAPHLKEIPTLIIDDEADQASINTSDPAKWAQGQAERTAINGLISGLLTLLPRAQYVGYTATPFANVFVDPSDSEDIFPRDFIFSLDRAPGYMGTEDFHDLDNPIPEEERTHANSNEKAYVRSITTDDGDGGRLREAIDMFLLTGAVKLYREDHGLGEGYFRHHTMLIHESVKQAEHAILAQTVRTLWEAGYDGSSGLSRLRKLYEKDVVPVSQARDPEGATLVDFNDLKPYVARAVQKINAGHNPVLVVNSDAQMASEAVDFEKRPVWRILVGGTKLSRGFTVEGLTISYYRRKTAQADTLMQMGRWFGFRWNYRDLVRLYIGRDEGHGGRYDLYEAFEAACRAESRFREQLRQYAKLQDGQPQVTPKDIPPLVTQHLPWLKPVAANKMFNVQLLERRSPGTPLEPVGYPTDTQKLKSNTITLAPLLMTANKEMRFKYETPTGLIPYDALVGTTSHSEFLEFLRALHWQTDDYFAPDLHWLESLDSKDIAEWIVMLPQHAGGGARSSIEGSEPRSVFRRNRRRGPLFGAISDPKHRATARRIADAIPSIGDVNADGLQGDKTGALLVYPVVELETGEPVPTALRPEEVVMAFVAVAPYSTRPPDGRLVTFVVRDPDHADDAIIDAL